MKISGLKEFDYNTVAVGDLVSEEIVDEAMDLLPPACMRSDCAQIGEPYSHKIDEQTGQTRATFATFKRISGSVWMYCGHCFRGENRERGDELQHA